MKWISYTDFIGPQNLHNLFGAAGTAQHMKSSTIINTTATGLKLIKLLLKLLEDEMLYSSTTFSILHILDWVNQNRIKKIGTGPNTGT